MTTLRISSPGIEDRLSGMKLCNLGAAYALQGAGVYGYNVKEVNGYLFVFGEDYIYVSSNGVSLVDTGYVGAGEKLNDIAYGNGKYVVVGENGLILSSIGPDAYGQWNWNIEVPADAFAGDFMCATFAEGYFLIGGGTDQDASISDPVIQRSANAVLWITCTITLDTSENGAVLDIEAGNGNILAVGSGVYDDGGSVYQQLALLSTAPDEDFEEDAVTLPALPAGAENAILFRALFTGSIFLTSGVYDKDVGEDTYTWPLLYQSGTGADFEDITDRLSIDKDIYPTLSGGLLPPSWPNMAKLGSNFFYMHYGSSLEIARLGDDGPDNFREVPIEKFGWKSYAVFGDNIYFMSILFMMRSDPFIPLPPAPVV